jgi:hypothetical protein
MHDVSILVQCMQQAVLTYLCTAVHPLHVSHTHTAMYSRLHTHVLLFLKTEVCACMLMHCARRHYASILKQRTLCQLMHCFVRTACITHTHTNTVLTLRLLFTHCLYCTIYIHIYTYIYFRLHILVQEGLHLTVG